MKGGGRSIDIGYGWIVRWSIEFALGSFLIYLATICFFPEIWGVWSHMYWKSIGSIYGMQEPLYSQTVQGYSCVAYTIVCISLLVGADKICDYGNKKFQL